MSVSCVGRKQIGSEKQRWKVGLFALPRVTLKPVLGSACCTFFDMQHVQYETLTEENWDRTQKLWDLA